jgi:hypothetical protein
MATQPQAKNLAELYELDLLEWNDVRRILETNLTQEPGTGGLDHHTFWLSTSDDDGRPHMTGVGAFWLDGQYYFCGSPQSRKIRNIERCAVQSASLSTASTWPSRVGQPESPTTRGCSGWRHCSPRGDGPRRSPMGASPMRTALRVRGRRPGTSTR